MAEDKLVAEAAELDKMIAEGVAMNQKLGAQIDAIREKRRALNAQIGRMQTRRNLIAVAGKLDGAQDALAPGATVVVSGKEFLQGVLASMK
jgi:hypothetical protein